jgi:hypothetical protein
MQLRDGCYDFCLVQPTPYSIWPDLAGALSLLITHKCVTKCNHHSQNDLKAISPWVYISDCSSDMRFHLWARSKIIALPHIFSDWALIFFTLLSAPSDLSIWLFSLAHFFAGCRGFQGIQSSGLPFTWGMVIKFQIPSMFSWFVSLQFSL